MVIVQICIECIAILESKNDSPVARHRYAPKSAQVASQSNKFGWHLARAVALIQPFEPLVAKADDHLSRVYCVK